jgi:hypothetical protein
MTGANDATVALGAGTLSAAAYTGALTVTDTAAGAASITTGTANDSIKFVAAASAAKTINIAAGGVDTIEVSHTATGLTTITGFTAGAGAGADVINIVKADATALAVTTAAIGTTAQALTTAATDPTNAVILTGANFQISGALTAVTDGGAVELAIIAAGLTAAANTNKAIVVLDNGTDTGVYQLTRVTPDAGGASATAIDLAGDFSVTHIVTLVGVADNSTLDATQFV